MRGEQRLGVAAEAEVGVDEDGSGAGQRRSEQLQHPVEHDGDVTPRCLEIMVVVLGAHEAQPPSFPPRPVDARRTLTGVLKLAPTPRGRPARSPSAPACPPLT
ncbi:hypothetical protein GCM10018952_56220 [Streptosporangium vulgare]